jgi:ElaB/YqjD/DUF883 family membrane-anchored ribosome-binding protein
MSELTASQRDKLIADLRVVISDAENLLKLTAGELGEGAVGVRERLQARLARARDRLLSLQDTALDSARAAGHATDDYVHDHPWQSVALGAGLGLVVGLLIGHRR